MHYQEAQYAPFQRRRMNGPFAIFGRGRMLSFLMMGVVSIFSFLSNNTNWVQPRAPFNNTQLSNVVLQPVAATSSNFQQPIAQPSAAPAFNPVVFHGGIIGDQDQGVVWVRLIGGRLVQHVSNLPTNAIRFYVLNDSVRSESYALSDGSILVTAGMLNRVTSEAQMATILSHRMTEILYNGMDRSQHPQIDQFPEWLCSQAGYRHAMITPPENKQVAERYPTTWSR